jgi:NifU-like protein
MASIEYDSQYYIRSIISEGEMDNTIAVEKDDIICNCFQITESEIRSQIAENDITEIEGVTSACDAGGECGSCHILIQLFIDQHQQKNAPKDSLELISTGVTAGIKGFLGKLFC